MLGCGDTPVQNIFGYLSNVTLFKALCAGGGNVTFGTIYVDLAGSLILVLL